MASKEFMELITKMDEIHIRKSMDYSKSDDAFSNFDFAADLVENFKDPIDQVFVVMIGIKLARLANLLNSSQRPQNESVEDSFIDLANYCVLWAAWYKKERENVSDELRG